MNWHSIKKEEVVRHLKSRIEGLNDKEAEQRLKEYGKNELKEVYRISPVKIFLKQFQNQLYSKV